MNLTKQKRFTSLVIIATVIGGIAATLTSCSESSTTVEDYVGVPISIYIGDNANIVFTVE